MWLNFKSGIKKYLLFQSCAFNYVQKVMFSFLIKIANMIVKCKTKAATADLAKQGFLN